MQENDYYWYKKPDSEIYKSVFPYVDFLVQDQGTRQEQNLDYLRLYGNDDLLGLRQYSRATRDRSSIQNRVTMNIVQSMVDTVHSKITKSKPKPMFVTNNGDWTLQRKAKKLNQFIEGQFYAMDYYDVASRAFLDSLVFGTGCAKFFKKEGKICAERVMIDEIIVDDREAIYGQPRQIHQKKWIHRDVLSAMFPAFKSDIEQAGKIPENNNAVPELNSHAFNEMIMVIESWRLPSSKKAKDGKHSICIDNATLFSEDYTKDFFPFVFWRWTLRPLGFFGRGIAEQLTGLQLEINKILRTIQVSMHLVSIPKIFMEAGSKIISSHIDNKIGGIIKYVGKLPEGKALGNLPPELFNHLNFLYTKAYEEIGVSQLSATSQKPQGLNSGKAMRVYNDIESERFMANSLRYEKTFLDASKICIDLAKEIADEEGSYPVRVKSRNGSLELIDWKDVAIEEDQYSMQMFPTSSLSSTPSARFQEVQELIEAGFVSKTDAMKLLDMPDLQRLYNFANAPGEDIDRAIELIVDKEDYQTPEPFQDLQYGKEKFQQAYLYYKSEGAPESVLELLRRWVSDAEELQKRAESQMAQEQQAIAQKAQMDAEQQMAMQQQEQDAIAAEEEAMNAAAEEAPLPLVNPAVPVPALPGDEQGLLTSEIPAGV